MTISMPDLPKDIINHILSYTDNKTFYNLLQSSKLFCVYDHNLISKQKYLERKYSNVSTNRLCSIEDLEGLKYLKSKGHVFGNQWNINYAAQYGHIEIIKWLCSIENKDCHWNNSKAIVYAAHSNQLEIIKWLLENLSFKIKYIDDSMIHAAQFGYLDIFKYLYNFVINDIQFSTTETLKSIKQCGTPDIRKFLNENKND